MKKILTTPIKDEDLLDLKVGDVVYLTGRLVTCRDVAHRRLIEQGRELPVNLEGGAIFHAGPIVRKKVKTTSRWFRLAQQPVCGWRNSSGNLLSKLALSLL